MSFEQPNTNNTNKPKQVYIPPLNNNNIINNNITKPTTPKISNTGSLLDRLTSSSVPTYSRAAKQLSVLSSINNYNNSKNKSSHQSYQHTQHNNTTNDIQYNSNITHNTNDNDNNENIYTEEEDIYNQYYTTSMSTTTTKLPLLPPLEQTTNTINHNNIHNMAMKQASCTQRQPTPPSCSRSNSTTKYSSHNRQISSTNNDNTTTLLSTMTTRLTQLEKQCSEYKAMLQQKDNEHGNLVDKLKQDNNILKQQLNDMNQFLNDYGLVWVGDNGNNNDDTASSSSDNDNVNADTKHNILQYDIQQLQQCVQQINDNIKNNKYQYNSNKNNDKQHKNNIVTLSQQHSTNIILCIYCNGLCINNHEFYLSNTDDYHNIINTLYNYDLPQQILYYMNNNNSNKTQQYTIQLIDKSDVLYIKTNKHNKQETFKAFTGQSYILSRRHSRCNSIHKRSRQNSIDYSFFNNDTVFDISKAQIQQHSDTNSLEHTQQQHQHQHQNQQYSSNKHNNKLTVQQLLSQLPTTIIHNQGQIVNVRNNVSNLFNQHKIESKNTTQQQYKPNELTVRCIIDTGKTIQFVLNNKTDTIHNIRQHISLHTNTDISIVSKYEIRSIYPAKVLKDDNQTLYDAQILYNTTLYIRTTH